MARIQYIKDDAENVILPVTHERGVKDSQGVNLETKLSQKQNTLISGTNLKTINGNSLLGSGDITVQTQINVDQTPTSGSTNPVSSGGVYSALENNNGIASITSQQDGTVSINLTNGDTVVIDLNHDHLQYLKFVFLEDESEMPVTPEATTLYLIKEEEE